jgi:uncharacterized RDD family membrane protein YckC
VVQRMSAPPPSPQPSAPLGGYVPTPVGSFTPPIVAIGGAAGDYAQWPTRALGGLIDSAFVFVAMIIMYFAQTLIMASLTVFTRSLGSDAFGGASVVSCCCGLAIFPLATLLVGAYNKVYLVSKRGFSIGQGVMKLKVVDANGKLLTTGAAGLRLLAQAAMGLIPILPLVDLLWPLWDEKRQTLHDKAVSSFVINNPSGT